MTQDFSNSRAQLAELLNQAAELEHSLCVQYLYAGFSLKTRVGEGVTPYELEFVRGWKRALFRVAREEMLHLGLICNLLSAIGYPPYFGRPNFPQSASYYPMGVPSALEGFSRATIDRFIAFEVPKPPPSVHSESPSTRTIGELYDEIARFIQAADARTLFVGHPSHQVTERQITDPTGEFDDEVRTAYGVDAFVIRDKKSALRAIDLIIEQGEGASEHNQESHYNAFVSVAREYDQLRAEARAQGREFVPARAVIDNPLCVSRPDAPSGTLITHPLTRELAELFNASYRTMLLMLIRFYNRVDDDAQDLFRLQQIIFFPMMTMVIRPLGEMLTELPAFPFDLQHTAGASFEVPRGLSLFPHRELAYRQFRDGLAEMAARAGSLRYLEKKSGLAPELRTRLEFLRENLERLVFNFDDLMSTPVQQPAQ